MAGQNKTCCRCGLSLPTKLFPPSKSKFHDGFFPWCERCIAEYGVENLENSWNAMDELCRAADIKFIPERFTKLFEPMKEKAFAQYLKLMVQAESYDSIDWKETNDKWSSIVAEGNINALHPTFGENEVAELKIRWGDHYTQKELEKLESMYRGIKESFGVGDEVGEDNARKLCMLSLEIDKCIASGGAGLDKLITPYNKIQANAGFTADNTRDANSFESVSELMLYMEKIGWKEKFVNDVPRDIVDLTIKDIQAHNTRLYRTESTIPDQVEEKISAKKRIEELESRIIDEEIEKHFDESWDVDYDDGEFEVEI